MISVWTRSLTARRWPGAERMLPIPRLGSLIAEPRLPPSPLPPRPLPPRRSRELARLDRSSASASASATSRHAPREGGGGSVGTAAPSDQRPATSPLKSKPRLAPFNRDAR